MNILDAASATVGDYPGGARSLAPRFPMGESTLCAEVAHRGTAKLGARTAARIVKLTGDTRILHAFADECGYTGIFFPHAAVDLDEAEVGVVTRMVKELSDVATEFGKSLADGEVTLNERDEFMHQAGELVAAVQAACEYVEARHSASVPQGLKAMA